MKDTERIEAELAKQSVIVNAHATKKKLEPVLDDSKRAMQILGCSGCFAGCITPIIAVFFVIVAATSALAGDSDGSGYAIVAGITIAVFVLVVFGLAYFLGLEAEKHDRAKKDMKSVEDTLHDT